jgi:hypothetical protein
MADYRRIDVMTDELIADLVAAASNMGQFFVGVPDEEMVAVLYGIEAQVEDGLRPELGADVASLVAESFVVTIIRRRREIEAGGAMPPVVLN